MMKYRYLPILLLASSLTGCATTGSLAEVSELHLIVAESRLEKTAQHANTWLASEALLEQARAAYAKADYPSAIAHAREVRYQSELAIAQSGSQKNASPWQF